MAGPSQLELLDGSGALADVAFKTLLGQMDKSISDASLPASHGSTCSRALFGQDRGSIGKGTFWGWEVK